MSFAVVSNALDEFADLVELSGDFQPHLRFMESILDDGAKRMGLEALDAIREEAPVGEKWTEDSWSWPGGTVDHGRPSERLAPYHTLREGWVDPPLVETDRGRSAREGVTATASVESIAGHIEDVILGSPARSFGPSETKWLAWRRSDNSVLYPKITNEEEIAFARRVNIGPRAGNPFHERGIEKSRSVLEAILLIIAFRAGDEYLDILKSETRSLAAESAIRFTGS